MTNEPCAECGAPMDPQQRYCVNCAARRANGANPSSRYFAEMSKKARRPVAKAPPRSPGSRAAAVGFFALLPIAVALGVMVGRGGAGGGDEAALLKALGEQRAAASAATAAGTTTTASAAGKAGKQGAKAKKSDAKPHEKVVAETENGAVHEVTDFHASKKKVEETTKIVESNPEQTGENYIKAQQNLPDVIPVGGAGGSAPASTGAEP